MPWSRRPVWASTRRETVMYARLVTVTGATNIDEGVHFFRETAMPALREQKGYRGFTASAARADGVLSAASNWDTAHDMEASDSATEKLRHQAHKLIGGKLTVETFEQLTADR